MHAGVGNEHEDNSCDDTGGDDPLIGVLDFDYMVARLPEDLLESSPETSQEPTPSQGTEQRKEADTVNRVHAI